MLYRRFMYKKIPFVLCEINCEAASRLRFCNTEIPTPVKIKAIRDREVFNAK